MPNEGRELGVMNQMNIEVPKLNGVLRRYLLRVIFCERLGIGWKMQEVERGETRITINGVRGEIRVNDDFLQNELNNRPSAAGMPDLPLADWKIQGSGLNASITSEVVPVLFGEPGVHWGGDRVLRLGLDIFGSAYFMLSRYEEVVLPDRDIHGRFPATASVAFRAGFLDRPIVDEYIEILWAAMKAVWPGLERKQKTFRVLVSHDVDQPATYGFKSVSKVSRLAAKRLVSGGNPIRSIREVSSWFKMRGCLHPDDPANTFEWIMDRSEENGLVSAFYFVCGRTKSRFDPEYEIEHPAIRNLIRRIHQRGHEVGLHPSYETFQNSEEIVYEAERLKRVCEEEGVKQEEWGGRMHYLRWETPTTLYGWEQAGMDYDSTLGYADHAGFRCGTCFEYPAFDPVAGKPLRLRIRPLIAMEGSVIGEKYMGLGVGEEAKATFFSLKEACRRVGGDFTLLWHNSSLNTEKLRALYKCTIDG